jgi:hypothetical protein
MRTIAHQPLGNVILIAVMWAALPLMSGCAFGLLPLNQFELHAKGLRFDTCSCMSQRDSWTVSNSVAFSPRANYTD